MPHVVIIAFEMPLFLLELHLIVVTVVQQLSLKLELLLTFILLSRGALQRPSTVADPSIQQRICRCLCYIAFDSATFTIITLPSQTLRYALLALV
jgi:hypothetical protein